MICDCSIDHLPSSFPYESLYRKIVGCQLLIWCFFCFLLCLQEGALCHRPKPKLLHPQSPGQLHHRRPHSPKQIKLSASPVPENTSVRTNHDDCGMVSNTVALRLGIDMNLNINVVPVFGASSPVNISKQLPTSSTGSGSCSVNEGRELAKKSRNCLPKESSRTTSSDVVYNISDDSDVDSKSKVNRLKRCSRNQSK